MARPGRPPPGAFTLWAGFLLLASLPAHAGDAWSEPWPGVRWLHRTTTEQNIHAAVVDLCAPGVSVRATDSSERGRRTSSYGSLVGAELAVNGDFSGAGYATDGLAMHAGNLWPGSRDHAYVGPAAFGDGQVDLVPHWLEAGPPAWAHEIVSGHPTILWDGVPVGHAVDPDSGDPLCLNRHPRTALGLSADRRLLILAVVDGRASGRIGMRCRELANLLAELGAHTGMNLDGGGSSTFWMAGRGVLNHPSDGSERVVGNHLGIFALGGGPAAHCAQRPPVGFLDEAGCQSVRGWAQDPDEPDRPLQVHVYFGGPAGSPAAVGQAVEAGDPRGDLCQAIGSCAHGFSLPSPLSLHDGAPHPVHAYGIDTAGGHNPELGASPKVLRCAPELPPGVRRHVQNPDSLAAWGLSLFWHVLPVPDPELAGREEGPVWPLVPRLVRADDGAPEVWVLDGDFRRHVSSPEVMQAWGLDWAAIESRPAAEIAARRLGPNLRARPVLARGSGSAVYVLDDPWPADEPAEEDGGLDWVADGGDGGLGEEGGGETSGDGGLADGEAHAETARVEPEQELEAVAGGCATGPRGAGLAGLGPLGWLLARRRRLRGPGR